MGYIEIEGVGESVLFEEANSVKLFEKLFSLVAEFLIGTHLNK